MFLAPLLDLQGGRSRRCRHSSLQARGPLSFCKPVTLNSTTETSQATRIRKFQQTDHRREKRTASHAHAPLLTCGLILLSSRNERTDSRDEADVCR